ncbi:MAG: hypothetical protein Q7S22_05870 [Candidatus Micrarchaeota archaeon]|nr:hypothetical protein [Candidatus Micrarchaeota archaeon]
MSAQIRVVQCNSARVGTVTNFFNGLGFRTTVKDTGEISASGQGTLVHVTLDRSFDPFKLAPESLARVEWSKLPLSVIE